MLNDATGLKKIYLAASYTDLRRGIDGLATMIRFRFQLDPYDKNTLFLFCGKKTNRIKGLLWESDGFLLLYKRLDNGAFSWPRSAEEALEISSEQYATQTLERFYKHYYFIIRGVPAMAIKYTEEQLNSVNKSMLVQMFLNQQKQLEKISADLHFLDTKMQIMMELLFFYEAEAVCDLDAPEPETLEALPARKKKSKGKKAQDMSELSTNRIDHYMTEEELTAEFGENGWKQLPDAIARRYRFVPAKVEVDEHHIGVYASKTDGHMIKAKHPKSRFTEVRFQLLLLQLS